MGTPDWSGWLASGPWAGSGDDTDALPAIVGLASNIVVGNNPPYTLQDFLAIYPKWGGPPITPVPTATLESGNEVIVVNSAAGMVAGNPIAGAGIPDGTFIVSIASTNVTLSNAPTANASNVALTVWNAPLIPFPVILLFIALASASLVQARWLDTWIMAMGLFVAHFATLYARSDGNPNSTVGQAAASGLAFGVQVAKSVGDVSVNYQAVQGIEDWGAWNLTSFGQQLATFARVIGMGPMLLY
jgi:hypothetical protein